ncbi:hypothetical protein [Panacibacter ginsenosidivorans]|uniref:hypothetical protein n=1 Tax=Panacibacter ginsenosidivorans TaxID=1813871 RepID=UPI001245727B|nr:hypothetical protein [Panacibacter ginsenosidivorans]
MNSNAIKKLKTVFFFLLNKPARLKYISRCIKFKTMKKSILILACAVLFGTSATFASPLHKQGVKKQTKEQVADHKDKHKDTKELKNDKSQLKTDKKANASAKTMKKDTKNVVKDKKAVSQDKKEIKKDNQKDKKAVEKKTANQ